MRYKNEALASALHYAIAFHDRQMRRTGEEPYVNHSVRVCDAYQAMMGVHATIPAAQAALLHDVVEDTSATLELLLELGFSTECVEIVNLLTRRANESKDAYLHRIFTSGNLHAMVIKLCDNNDNSQMSFRGVWPNWEEAVGRYAREKIRIIRAIRYYIESTPNCGVTL